MLFRFDGKAGYAIYDGQVNALQVGKFSSTAAGYGFTLTKTRSFAFRSCADDGGVVFTTGASVKAKEARLLLTAVHTGNISAHGGENHLKVTSDCSGVTGFLGGSWDYLEMGTSAKVAYAGGSRSMLDIPSGAAVTGAVGSFLAAAGDISGTHSASVPVAVVAATNPTAGSYDAFAYLGSATGCNITSYTGNSAFIPNSKGTFTQVGQLKINIAGTTYYIPYGTVA